MKYKSIYLVVLLLISTTFHINAQSISPDEAAARAQQFIAANFPLSRASQSVALEPVDIVQHLYVFNVAGGGYVILSGEATVDGIIGYSTTGRIDKNNLPPNMRVALDGYSNEIKSVVRTSSNKSRSVVAAPVYRKAIEPMVKRKWGQSSPFNTYCFTESGEKALTGCGPTAMAQLMGYYNWPAKGHGMLYLRRYYGATPTDSLNLDTTPPIDWKNMRDVYNVGVTTQAERDAVAMLMKMCGFACNAKYGVNATSVLYESPAKGLRSHFYYNVEMRWPVHFSGDYTAMHNYIYNALSDGKPLICSIDGIGNEGHAIVIDGCDSNGFFHINWGWEGSHDGYFRMCSLKEVGYTFGAFGIIILASPDYEMRGDDDINYQYSTGFVRITDERGVINYSNTNTPNDKYVNFLGYDQEFRNLDLGIRIAVSENENKVIYLYSYDEQGNSNENETTHTCLFQTDVTYLVDVVSKMKLSNGRYKCYPVYKKPYTTNWNDFNINFLQTPRYVFLIVNGDNIVFTTPSNKDIVVRVADKMIYIDENHYNGEIQVFNTYGLCVYSGQDDKISVSSPGIYTVKIGTEFYKTVIVK